jgi:hypothetical protein
MIWLHLLIFTQKRDIEELVKTFLPSLGQKFKRAVEGSHQGKRVGRSHRRHQPRYADYVFT